MTLRVDVAKYVLVTLFLCFVVSTVSLYSRQHIRLPRSDSIVVRAETGLGHAHVPAVMNRSIFH
jgi:hypothetical protein